MNPIIISLIIFSVVHSHAMARQVPSGKVKGTNSQDSFIINDSVLIKTKDGATLSAIVVRKKGITAPLPAALVFTIYTDYEWNLQEAKQSAEHGFVGVVADARGKRLSPDEISPYENEVKDVNAVIDWIVQQSWSNGKVGMYGGSYLGFAQWAATKTMHPALKTIVPYVAAIPGQGLPMENNVFLNANYGWAFYVCNNKYLDTTTYYDRQRWDALPSTWYRSGLSYRKLDSIDGTPNKYLQRWLQHPSFDKYWQDMIPYKNEYSNINIPVLTITGYYDDGQLSAMRYVREHYKFNKHANHYLIIGPYDHFGAQRGGSRILRGYSVDPVAIISTREITYEWLAYVMKDGKKPAILEDKINFEVMGANKWRHAPSIDKMHNGMLTFYLSGHTSGNYFQLSDLKPASSQFLTQEVDLADRNTSNNTDYYPYPIIKKKLDHHTGLFFISKPLDNPVIINGSFTGQLRASINKKDMDVGVTLYEILPDSTFFHLSYFLGRASYAWDITSRKLLTPGQIENIPFDNTRMVCKQINKGSRLLVVLDINKNQYAQVNFGTGKDVSDESVADGKVPLQVKWYNDSYIKIPIWKDN
jgi:putative CocE/NonD family hydrolase